MAMKEQKYKQNLNAEAVLDSYCQVCFVPFNRIVPKKLDEGEQILVCVKCKCNVHKCCYDMEATSSFVTTRIKQFVCERCNKTELNEKGCIICFKKQGALKQIGNNEVIHVFCGLMHNEIITVSYFPEITFKKSESYKEVRNLCGICSKPNATQQCAMDSCFKRYHSYCIELNFKQKQQIQEDPQCQKHYLSSGDNGKFDVANQIMPRAWVYQEFDKVLMNFEEYGFKVLDKQKIKQLVYLQYQKDQRQQKNPELSLRRGGFVYVLCNDHESSLYCNCLNRGTGQMVQCQCCFQWYHSNCVKYQPNKSNENYICPYCYNFYELKKKIIDQVKNTKTETYDLKFQTPKLHLNDYIWLLRVIDHRIAGGGAVKMLKELAKYPLKTSKMELVMRNQNKKKLSNLTEAFIQTYLESKQHQSILKTRPVLGLDQEQKPTILRQNVQYNRKLKKYIEFIQNFVRRNNLRDSFGSIIHELKFKQKAVEDNYDVILELSRSQSGYPQIPILKIKVEEYSFMEVIKELDSGSTIKFEELEKAVMKSRNSSAQVPSYLLKPLIQRYEKVKNLVQLVSKNIHQKKESSSQTQNAVRKLKQQKILPPQVYVNFYEQKKFINELYLLYLKQEGKPLEESLQTQDKIEILLRQNTCKLNREIADCVNSFVLENQQVFEGIDKVLHKYLKSSVIYQLKQSLKKKSIKLSHFESLFQKFEKMSITEIDNDISELANSWRRIREEWKNIKEEVETKLSEIDSITEIMEYSGKLEALLKTISGFSLQFVIKTEDVPQLGSLSRLEELKSFVDVLGILFTEAQLKKNPLTIHKIPEGLSRQNPLVKQYYNLKAQQVQLIAKYNEVTKRASTKIEILKNDPKKPRNEQMKQNLQKPRLTDVNNLIEELKKSRVSMDAQIKQLTKYVNKSIEIGSRVNKFIAEQKHLESLFKQDQADNVKKQIDQLRKKVLTEGEICLENELKQLYQAEICVRIQKMLVSANPELQKMNKLLKFAQQEGLNHLPIYKKLKSKFEVGNQSTKEINLTKKHQQYLLSQSQKLRESDTYYNSLVFARRSLPLSLPQQLKQKNKHYEDLLTRNIYLKNKINLILAQEPKKYDIQQVKSVYFEALKHPFEIEGLNKLIHQFEKAQNVLSTWRQDRQIQSSNALVFYEYQSLIFNIEEISSHRRTIQESEEFINRVKKFKSEQLSLQTLAKVQESMQIMQQNVANKNLKLMYIFKVQYYSFWVKLLKSFEVQQNQAIPFSKIKSLLFDIYSTLQKNLKNGFGIEQLREFVNYFEDLMVGIKNQFQRECQVSPTYNGFIDLEQLKYEVSSGLEIKDQIKILNPFHDMNRFYHVDLQRIQSRNFDENNPIRRQRTQTELEDPYQKQTKVQKTHKNIIQSNEKVNSEVQQKENNEDWQKNDGSIVSEAQRSKAKEVILKNIKKNPQLCNYQNLSEQVKLIENQLFGDNHNQVFKYFELVNSFEKLFIKLLSCPNVSGKVVKKKFEWGFLMLLINNIQQISEIQLMLVEKNKEIALNEQKEAQKKEQKQKQAVKQAAKKVQDKKDKQKTIQQMIATGQIDESIRKQMKREIKAIREKNKKKKHKSKSRKRSRSSDSSSKSEAKFSSESQQYQQPAPAFLDYVQGPNDKGFSNQFNGQKQPEAPLLFDPQLSQFQQGGQYQKNFPRGSIIQLKSIDVEMNIKKKGKVIFKCEMMTTQDHQKIMSELIDPNFNPLLLKRDKPDHQIIQYLNKPSRRKYKFLVGWFQAFGSQENQNLRDFSIDCNNRNKIFGVQNENIKMHIMSVHQYSKIIQLFDIPSVVSSEAASEILKVDRLVYIIQYPADKMYDLKQIYPNFSQIIQRQSSFAVEVPIVNQINASLMDRSAPFMPSNFVYGYNPLIMPQQPMKPIETNPLKPVEYEGWGDTTSISSFSGVSNYSQQNFNQMNILSRFSPILTQQQDNDAHENKQTGNQAKEQKQIDLASNILNSLADVNLSNSEIPIMTRGFPQSRTTRQQPYRYQQIPTHHQQQQMVTNQNPQISRWPNHSGMPIQQMNPRPMGMPYNPMSMVQKYPPQPQQRPPVPSMMYNKNPMIPQNPYGYPPGSINQVNQTGAPYDPYNMYKRQ